MKKIIIAIFFFACVIALALGLKSENINTFNQDNIQFVDGVQYINLKAKGGYNPRKLEAKANTPTVLRFETETTFDCSASLRLPSLNKSQLLPMTGLTDIDIGTSTLGIFRGTCGMGMYSFEINFKD